MPRKPKKDVPVEPVESSFPKELVDRLVPGPMTPRGLDRDVRQLKKVVIEWALGAEMTAHLGYGAGEAKPEGGTNSRNRLRAKSSWRFTEPYRHRSVGSHRSIVLPNVFIE